MSKSSPTASQPQTVHAERYRETIGSTGEGKPLALQRLGMDVCFHGVIVEGRRPARHGAVSAVDAEGHWRVGRTGTRYSVGGSLQEPIDQELRLEKIKREYARHYGAAVLFY